MIDESLLSRKCEATKNAVGLSNALKKLTTIRRNMKSAIQSEFVDPNTVATLEEYLSKSESVHADIKKECHKCSQLARAYIKVIDDLNNLK